MQQAPEEGGDMRMQRKGLLMGCCLLIAALRSLPALGQEQPQKPSGESQAAKDIRLTRVAIDTKRQALITRGMDLTPDEMQRFWPLYREYWWAAMQVGDQIVPLPRRDGVLPEVA
jgi:hypothetical protein